MGQEFVIKSTTLEDKINQLLPSQGGAQAGVDLSASTTIIPIVDLTESAEGSNLREDLQSSFSLNSITHTQVNNATTTLVNTTGYFRVFGTADSQAGGFSQFQLTDGVTTKSLLVFNASAALSGIDLFDFIVFLQAGESLVAQSSATSQTLQVTTRQIADINGNLVNPT
jgi:hypothetical protein